jgi:hypothetical protein
VSEELSEEANEELCTEASEDMGRKVIIGAHAHQLYATKSL